MFVSAEIIAIVVSAIGITVTMLAAMFAGFAWCVRRIDAVEERLTRRIDEVAADTTDLKISIARIEGPQRHLILAPR